MYVFSTLLYIQLRPPQPAVYMFVLDVSHNAVDAGYLKCFCESLLENLDKSVMFCLMLILAAGSIFCSSFCCLFYSTTSASYDISSLNFHPAVLELSPTPLNHVDLHTVHICGGKKVMSCYSVCQVAWRHSHQDRLPHLRQHHPLLQPAGGAVPATDAGGVRHRWYVSSSDHTQITSPRRFSDTEYSQI